MMGRAAKHNWQKLLTEFRSGDYSSLADFAKRHKISYDMLRKEFKKLGYNSGQKPDKKADKTPAKQPDKITGRKPDKGPPPIGRRKLTEDGLTPQQDTFVQEYLLDFNATRAALAAGYSKRTAYAIGYNLLKLPNVQKKLQELTEQDSIRLGLNRERVLREYMRIAFADVGSYVRFGQKEVQVMGPFGPIYANIDDGNGGSTSVPVTKVVNYVDFESSEIVDTALISEVKQGRDGCSIKLHDKMKALEKLEKYLDLLPDEHKRRVENEKLRIDWERLALEKAKVLGEPDETEDDGFIEALHGKAGEAWDGHGDSEEG